MSAEKTIRYQARLKLKNGGWPKALISLAILVVFFMIVDSVYYTQTILTSASDYSNTLDFIIKVSCRSVAILLAALFMPAVMGYFKMLCSDDGQYNISDVLFFFKDFTLYCKSVAFVFAYILRMIIPAIVCYAPVLIFILVKVFLLENNMSQNLYITTLVILTVLSTLILLIYSIKYFLSLKLFCENQNYKLKYYFVTSNKLMYGNCAKVIKLALSFTLWILLSITVLPLLYTIPYFTQAMCLSGKWICEVSRNGLENELL